MTAGVYGEITKDGQNIVLAVTGTDWELSRAGTILRHMTPLLTKTEPKGMLLCPLTYATVVQLGHSFSSDSTGQWIPGARLYAWTLDEFTRRHAAIPVQPAIQFQHAARTPQSAIERQPAARDPQPAKPAQTGLQPRSYQLDAAAMIANTGKFLLFDEPGCGKTVSTILGLQAWQRDHELFPLVIITPSWDVADVWLRHIRDWAPDWPEPVMYGGPDRSTAGKILLTTYATARIDAADAQGPLAKLKPVAIVLDEAHQIKNIQAKQTGAVTRIARHADCIVALTGTPVTRDTGDIFPVLAAMDPRSYPSRERFVKRYLQTADDGYGEVIEGLAPLAEPEFRAVLAGQYRRVSKADVASELPPKIYSVRRVELPAQWRTAYDGMERDMLAQLPDGEGELPVMSVLAQLTRLSQLASSACDVAVFAEPDEITGEVRTHYEVTLKAPSWKADCLLEILAERPGQQVAVFAESRQLTEIAGQACEKAGYKCGFITGNQARALRTAAIDGFQAGRLDVMLATSGAGGLGITLTAAGTAVLLQRSWALDKAIQVEDRLHRLGQVHEAVEIIDIVARGTVDERVRALLKVKGGRLAELVKDKRVAMDLLGGLR